MGVGYAILEVLMKTTVGQLLLRGLSTISTGISERGKNTVRNEVTIDEVKAGFPSAAGTPAPLNIDFKISSKTALNLQISAVNLRIGFAEGGMTIQNFTWSDQITEKTPKNLHMRDIEPKRGQWQMIELVLPPYFYFEEETRKLYLDGAVVFDTVFGPVELPVSEHFFIDEENLQSVEDTQEFFSERS